jgi:GNAT superfamily N-acetyltransferase
MQIRELDLKELPEAYEVLCQLRVDMDYKEFEDLVYEMRHKEYKMIGVFEALELVTYVGVYVQTNFHYKRHLFVDDLVTYDSFRSRGYGDAMFEYLVNFAKVAMCENIVVSSVIDNIDAHKFFETMDFERESYTFVKSLK